MGMVKKMIFELEEQEKAERLEQDNAEEEFAERILSGAPIPIPCDPMSDGLPCLAWELFTPALIQSVIEENRDWLEVTSRSTRAIIHAIFPRFIPAGMTEVEISKAIGVELLDAGFRPSGPSNNLVWTFPV